MFVELDIFSGRPNPRWQLDAPGAGRLLELHRHLTAGARPSAEPPGLGYRGFCYELDDASWRVWNATVISGDRALLDPDRSVERLLLEGLPAEYDDLRSRLSAEIARAG